MESGSVTVKRRAVKQLESLKRRVECKDWIEEITNIELGSPDEFEKDLCDGLILIELLNRIQPELLDMSKIHYKCKTIANTDDTFKMIENITLFTDAAIEYGAFTGNKAFSPIDLINGKNIEAFLMCLLELKSKSMGTLDSGKDKKSREHKSESIPLVNEKPIDPERTRGLKRLASMPKKDLIVLLNESGIRHEKDIANMQGEPEDAFLPEPPQHLCIICKKETNKITSNGLIYYHPKCIFCSKCGIYFIKEHKKGWFWRRGFYCMDCMKKSMIKINRKIEKFS